MKAIRVAVGLGALILTMCVGQSLLAQAPAQGGAAQAQGRGGPPAPPQNLQILPKDIPRADLLATMRGFTAGLGVQCNYCHVQEGRGGRNDMATDEKQPKKTARVMMQMMAHVNETLVTIGKPAADITKVECATCHRGEAIPKNPPPPPPPAAPAASGGQAPGL
jgi:hypothetical protein